MSALRFDKPDWLSSRLPVWNELLLPLRGKPLQLLEVGSYEGRSACWLAQNLLEHPFSSLRCIDPCLDEDVAANLRDNLASLREGGNRLIVLLERRSDDALPRLYVDGCRFDVIYIDGSHEAPDVLFDAALSFKLLRTGGLMCFDDYIWSKSLDGTVHAPQLAINAFAAVHAEQATLIHRDVQAWFRKK